ncbi:MAG: hypothetical protein K0U72_02925 [Gammaproteobacteria bacterium]|nr:hypothetical protein [Gammaproteobacteria bacterium]
MNKILNSAITFLTRRRKPNVDRDGEAALWNYSLHLAQEWGNDWMQPIQQRLAKAFPHFSESELDRLNDLAQNAMRYSYNIAYDLYEKTQGGDFGKEWKSACLSRYAWIDDKNLNQLLSTGRFYAMKDLG